MDVNLNHRSGLLVVGRKMSKVLIINTSGLGMGGITTHMLNYLRRLKEMQYEAFFSIVVTGVRDKNVLEQFENLGCELVYLPDRKKKLWKYCFALRRLLRNNDFDVLHVHGNSSTMGIELSLGKQFGIPVRIAHCHNSKCEHPYLHKLLLPIFKKSYTQAVACSSLAGDWIFGKGKYIVLANAIDLDKFQFNAEVRKEYRKALKVADDTLLLGHVGNFNEQKNHDFLIDIFDEVQKKKKAELILIGTGPLLADAKKKVNNFGMQDKVHFLGIRDDVGCWMQAMDCFVFPSKWEGFGMVLIEGQTSNLPMVVSTEVPIITKVTDNIRYISLSDGTGKWANLIINLASSADRIKPVDSRIKEYDINNNIEKLTKLYR